MSIRSALKRNSLSKYLVIISRTLAVRPGFLRRFNELSWFFGTYRAYRKLPANTSAPARTEDLYPRLYDNSGDHKLDPVYFYQNAWTARKIFQKSPARHWDVGSHNSLTSIVSQYVPLTMIDIRPLNLPLDGLDFQEGDITKLPFEDNSIPSLSSICVIEHIGLGRYGDTLDPFGSEKAAHELVRVLAQGGDLYITAPIDSINRTYFNAHRAFTPEYMKKLFPLSVIEEKYLYGNTLQDSYDSKKGFGTGMYHFKKN